MCQNFRNAPITFTYDTTSCCVYDKNKNMETSTASCSRTSKSGNTADIDNNNNNNNGDGDGDGHKLRNLLLDQAIDLVMCVSIFEMLRYNVVLCLRQ